MGIGKKGSIFHEKQDGQLCAQHCVNSLLQGSHYNAVDLAELAEEMDFAEKKKFEEAGVDSREFQNFLKKPSENMDDTGYFSVQVISCALALWGLEMLPFNSSDPRVAGVRNNLSDTKAFICNSHSHWFTIRKFGNQWFNLNSTLNEPKYMSEIYLQLFLNEFIEERNSVFVIFGDLPPCTADSDELWENNVGNNDTHSEGNLNRSAEQLGEITKTLSRRDDKQEVSLMFTLNNQKENSTPAGSDDQINLYLSSLRIYKWLSLIY